MDTVAPFSKDPCGTFRCRRHCRIQFVASAVRRGRRDEPSQSIESSASVDSQQDAPSNAESKNTVKERGDAGATIPKDTGTHIVGHDVKKGRYRAVQATGDCFWWTYKDIDTSDDNVLDSGTGPGQVIIVLTEVTKAVEVSDCPEFRPIDSERPAQHNPEID